MSPSPDANELLDRSAALLQSQSTLIETLLRRCKDLYNDAEILRGTVKATVAERDEARARLTKQNESMKNLDRVGMEATIAMRDDIVRLGRERDEARACFSAEKSANEELHKRVSEQMPREEIIEKASRAYWDGPRRDGSKATVPWDDKYLNELWKARVRDQIESALIAVGVIQ